MVAKRVKAWTRVQARAFIVAATESPHLHGGLWLTQLGTGLRPSEALELDRARVRVT